MNLHLVKDKITKSGLKFTHQRMVIYKSILLATSHPTAEQVFEDVKADNPSISVATVYKTLDSFVQAGMIQRFVDQNGVMRFDAIVEAHSHLYCKHSHQIKDYRNEILEKLLSDFVTENPIDGFEVEEISVVFKGYHKN